MRSEDLLLFGVKQKNQAFQEKLAANLIAFAGKLTVENLSVWIQPNFSNWTYCFAFAYKPIQIVRFWRIWAWGL